MCSLLTDARRTMNRVSSSEAKLARARMALRLYRGGVDWALRRVPDGLKRDPGLLYERLKWRRRKDRIDDAVEILLDPPRDLIRLPRPLGSVYDDVEGLFLAGSYAVRRPLFEALGGFDEGLAYAENTDLALRLIQTDGA